MFVKFQNFMLFMDSNRQLYLDNLRLRSRNIFNEEFYIEIRLVVDSTAFLTENLK